VEKRTTRVACSWRRAKGLLLHYSAAIYPRAGSRAKGLFGGFEAVCAIGTWSEAEVKGPSVETTSKSTRVGLEA
jgi:hypothetical protein